MICVSIGESNIEECINALRGIDFAEIRLDKMEVTVEGIKKIFSLHPCLIATCRSDKMDDKKRKTLLSEAIAVGAAFVDIEVESDDRYRNEIIEKARAAGCQVIISYHNFAKTPERAELEHAINWCFESGADIAKIACRVSSVEENTRLLSLLVETRPLIVVGIGNKGKITRVAAPLLGSPFTYASLVRGKETAEGQIDIETLKEIFEKLKNA